MHEKHLQDMVGRLAYPGDRLPSHAPLLDRWAVVLLMQIDQITIEELDIISQLPHCVPISAHHNWNLDELIDKVRYPHGPADSGPAGSDVAACHIRA